MAAALANEATTQGINELIAQQLPIPDGATPGQIKQILDDRNGLANIASTMIGAAGAAAVGGNNASAIATGANVGLTADQFNRQLHPDQIKRIQQMSPDAQKQNQLTAVLCVLQNCDVNGLSGYDSNGQALYSAGTQLLANNPEQFKQLAAEVSAAGLLSGQFAYGTTDLFKDAIGKQGNDLYNGMQDAGTRIKNVVTGSVGNGTDVLKGVAQGLANLTGR